MKTNNRKDSTQLVIDVMEARGECFDVNSLDAWKNSSVSAVKLEVIQVLGSDTDCESLEDYDALDRATQAEVREKVLTTLVENFEGHQSLQSLPNIVANIETLSAVSFKPLLDVIYDFVPQSVRDGAGYYVDLEVLEILKLLNRSHPEDQIRVLIRERLSTYGVEVEDEILTSWFDLFGEINEKLQQEYHEILTYSDSHKTSRNLSYARLNKEPRFGRYQEFLDGFGNFQLRKTYLENELLQSQEKNRSIVELVSNSIDATPEGDDSRVDVTLRDNGFTIQDNGEGMTPYVLLEKLMIPKISGKDGVGTIGRFGIGFYTALAHLKDSSDQVRVVTNNGTDTYEIVFSRHSAAKTTDEFHELSIQTRKLESGDHPQGTSITLECGDFDAGDAEALLRGAMRFSSKMPIHLQAEYRGSDESELVNTSEGLEAMEMGDDGALMYDPVREDRSKVTLLIKDITIEDFYVSAPDVPRELVLNFPATCILSENRSEVEFDESTFQDVLTLIVSLEGADIDPSLKLSLINTLTRVFAHISDRFKRSENQQIFGGLEQVLKTCFPEEEYTYLPNTLFCRNFDVSDSLYVDQSFTVFDPELIEDFEPVAGFEPAQGYDSLYIIDFAESSSQWILFHHSAVIMDRSVYEKHRETPMFLNVYLSDLDHTKSDPEETQDRKDVGKVLLRGSASAREQRPLRTKLPQVYEDMLFPDQYRSLYRAEEERDFFGESRPRLSTFRNYSLGYYLHKNASRKLGWELYQYREQAPKVAEDFIGGISLKGDNLDLGSVNLMQQFASWSQQQGDKISEEQRMLCLGLALQAKEHILTEREYESLAVSTELGRGRGVAYLAGHVDYNQFLVLLQEVYEAVFEGMNRDMHRSLSWDEYINPPQPPKEPWKAERDLAILNGHEALADLVETNEFWGSWLCSAPEEFIPKRVWLVAPLVMYPAGVQLLHEIAKGSPDPQSLEEDLADLNFFLDRFMHLNYELYGWDIYIEEKSTKDCEHWRDPDKLIYSIWHFLQYANEHMTVGKKAQVMGEFGKGLSDPDKQKKSLWESIITQQYEEVPVELRGFAVSMTEGAAVLSEWDDGAIELASEDALRVRLSTLMSCKSLNQSVFAEIATQEDLVEQIPSGRVRNYNAYKQLRDIRHVVEFQVVNDRFLWIREMLQNSIDALVDERQKRESGDEVPKISINAYAEGDSLVTEIFDPVGMDYNTVVNYLFVVGESTKRTRDDLIGAFGQGFMTILKGADKVMIKTGSGNGKTTYVTVRPMVAGDFTDYQIEISERDEDFKGTQIKQWATSDDPVSEAAICKSSVLNAGGLVDPNEVCIEYKGERINKPRHLLSEREVTDRDTGINGTIRLYTGKENMIYKSGLPIHEIDERYYEGVPPMVVKKLQESGLVIMLPSSSKVIRGRGSFVDEKQVVLLLQEYLPGMMLEAYIKSIASGRFNFPELPYDFSDAKERKRFRKKLPPAIEEDAQLIARGENLDPKALAHYVRNQDHLIWLLLLLPVFEIPGEGEEEEKQKVDYFAWIEWKQKQALREFANALKEAKKDTPPPSRTESKPKAEAASTSDEPAETEEEEKPKKTAEPFNPADMEEREIMTDTVLPDDNAESVSRFPALYFLRDVLRALFGDLKGSGDESEIGFYYATTKHGIVLSNAHAYRGYGDGPSFISFNLGYIENELHFEITQLMKCDFRESDSYLQKFLENLILLLSHEMQHRREGSSSLTHNSGFFHGQRRILSESIARGDAKIMEEMPKIMDRYKKYFGDSDAFSALECANYLEHGEAAGGDVSKFASLMPGFFIR